LVSLEKLQKFSGYFRTRITEIKEKIEDATTIKNKISVQVSNLRKQLNELNVDEKVQTGEIKIKLNTENYYRLKFNYKIQYKRGWLVSYI
jgi:hypothetical protein